jgi:hypothetical protein
MHASLLEVFNERDRARRLAAIARTYASDIRWTDDEGVTTGHDALDAKAEALQAKLDDLQFIADGPSHQTLGLGYQAFRLVDSAGGAVLGTGFDVAIIRDDRIAELYTVLTDEPR